MLLPLVMAMKTQREPERIRFWLRELRTAELLIEVVQSYPGEAESTGRERAAVRFAIGANQGAVEVELATEESRERELDRAYWAPLRQELEQLRHAARRA